MPDRVETLKTYFQSKTDGQARRPILTSLNGDGSWLISFPLPSPSPRKSYYHIATEAWLNGPATQGTSWFICIDLTEPPAAKNGADIDAIIREIEGAAGSGGDTVGQETTADEEGPWLDAIFVGFHYLDHMHQPTLLTLDKSIPLFATREAAGTVRSWGHFETVITTHDFQGSEEESGKDWRDYHPGSPLPPWLSVFRLSGNAELIFATVIVWSHDSQEHDEGGDGVTRSVRKHEVLLNTPHGVNIDSPSVQAFFNSTTKTGTQPEEEVEALLLLAATKESLSLGIRTTLGIAGSLALERLAGPRYWVRSHDSTLRYRGALLRLIWTYDVQRTLDDGLEEEKKAQGDNVEKRRPNFVDVANGRSFVLE
ncbi:hypothetical protein SLS53_004967 [Cytospora paraplurivora]|uniref:Uncharacterized protein n=1 Tax=Cytospora paraplurivora TaxID=2898453 RepID=A0AAN9YGF7_9PEZI